MLGLTSYSHWPEAKAVRHCALQHAGARQKLLALAKQHLKGMLHVGLMEQIDASVASLAVSAVLVLVLFSCSLLCLS